MSGGGLSEARLERMHDLMAAYVEGGQMPLELVGSERFGTGVVSLVYRSSDEKGS